MVQLLPLFCQPNSLISSELLLHLKSAGVRKTSILALQNLYEVDDNVPSLGLFTERFCNRMVEIADDVDVSVAVSAIGLLKQLLRYNIIYLLDQCASLLTILRRASSGALQTSAPSR